MITKKDVDKLAELSLIYITDEEKESFAKDIDSILSYVSMVSEVSEQSEKKIPLLVNIMRDDVVTNTSGEYTEKLLSSAPESTDGFVVVKKILS